MSSPEQSEALTLRLAAVEASLFALTEQVRRIGDTTERNAHSLDDLEEVLTDVSLATAHHADAMTAAMTQRQAYLDTHDDAPPVDLGEPAPASDEDDTPGKGGGLRVPDLSVLHAWVETHIAPLTRKTTTTGEGGGVRWCKRWWEHHDAVERFLALFLAFEELSAAEESATWLSVYLRDHLDPHLSTLTSPYGPFYACSPLRHSDAYQPLGHAELAQPQQEGSHP